MDHELSMLAVAKRDLHLLAGKLSGNDAYEARRVLEIVSCATDSLAERPDARPRGPRELERLGVIPHPAMIAHMAQIGVVI